MPTAIPGTILADKVSPGNTNTTFPTHEDVYGKGGLMSFSNLTTVTTATDPDRLPLDRQKKGMLLYDQNTQKYYALYDVSTNATLKTTNNPIFEIKGAGDQIKLYSTEITSLTSAGLITAVKGLSSGDDIELFNNKKIKLGYSPVNAGFNDGAEIFMDFPTIGDNGELVIGTRDNGTEAIVFRQSKNDANPSYDLEPLIIGTDNNIGIGAVSATRTFPAKLTVNGTVSATNLQVGDKITTYNLATVNTDISATVIDVTNHKTFANSDNNKIFHFDTTTKSLCAIFPTALSNGFNVGIMNVGTNTLQVSSADNYKSVGSFISVQYGGAFVYKQGTSLFAVGKLV